MKTDGSLFCEFMPESHKIRKLRIYDQYKKSIVESERRWLIKLFCILITYIKVSTVVRPILGVHRIALRVKR